MYIIKVYSLFNQMYICCKSKIIHAITKGFRLSQFLAEKKSHAVKYREFKGFVVAVSNMQIIRAFLMMFSSWPG